MRASIRVQTEPFDPLGPQAELWAGQPMVGAVVSFIGLMRDMNQGERVLKMTLEHYPGMTEKALRAIVDEAAQRWELQGVQLLHRVGVLCPEDPIVLVAVASAHRGEAFQACEFIIDYLKTRAPFWKKETTETGERWVERRSSDSEAERRWSRNPE
jgi:molybdopterin synthase catalytic subunit